MFSGYGLNCEEETKFAFDSAGAQADIVHINDLIDGRTSVSEYQILAFPGGFSYGDDTGSGNAYANKLRNHLWDELKTFTDSDGLAIGICNGFQILSNLGLLPAIDGDYGTKQAALLHNTSNRYTVRWVDLEVRNDSPWLKGISNLSLPIAHGEGRLFADEAKLTQMKQNNQIALSYAKGEISEYLDLPANPNGSLEDIAGITDQSGRIFGLMPHPERALFFTHLPQWPILMEQLRRKHQPAPEAGPGAQIFQQAVSYFD